MTRSSTRAPTARVELRDFRASHNLAQKEHGVKPSPHGRLTSRVAVAGAAALVAGLFPGWQSSAQDKTTEVVLTYDCEFPSGAKDVEVVVAGAFPERGSVGRAMQPKGMKVDATLPAGGVEELLPGEAEAVASVAALSVQVTNGADKAEASWAGLNAETTPVSPGEDLKLSHSGEVPSVTVGSGGEVRFRAGDLSLDLQPVSESTAGAAPLRVECAIADGQDGLLAKVSVPGTATPDSSPSASPGERGADRESGSPNPDGPGLNVSPKAEKDPRIPCKGPRPEINVDESLFPPIRTGPDYKPPVIPPNGGIWNCLHAVGISNLSKLRAGVLVNNPEAMAPTHLIYGMVIQRGDTPETLRFSYMRHKAQMELPDSHSTALAFGFMPVTATVQVDIGPMSGYSLREGEVPPYQYTYLMFKQSIRLKNVRVNGVPLDVGPNCRTSKPADVTLTGFQDDSIPWLGDREYQAGLGGLLREEGFYIPKFIGCGTGGENLNRLFTAAIHGPGNYIELNQGFQCSSPGGATPPLCPNIPMFPKMPAIPKVPQYGE